MHHPFNRRFRRLRAAASALLAVFAAGTAARAQRPAGVEVRDSAGVTIVLNTGDVAPRTWRIDPEPLVTLTVPAGDSLRGVVGGARLADGFAAGTALDGRVRYFDARGRQVRAVGGRGQGPGEFDVMRWVGGRGDSVAVWDSFTGRLSVLDAQGRTARTATVPQNLLYSDFHGFFADGSFLIADSDRGSDGDPGEVWRLYGLFVRMNPDGSVADTVGEFDTHEVYGTSDDHWRLLPLGRRTWAEAGREVFYLADGSGWEFSEHLPDGQINLRVRRDVAPIPIPEADREAWRRSLREIAAGVPPDARKYLEEEANAPRFAGTYAPYERMHLDDEGRVWLLETIRVPDWGRPPAYSVFDADGRWIARVEGLPFFRLLQIGEDWVLGRYASPDGDESVRLHRLVRPEAP